MENRVHDEYVVFLKPFKGGRITRGIIPLVRRKAVQTATQNTSYLHSKEYQDLVQPMQCEEEYSVDYRTEASGSKGEAPDKEWRKTEAGWRTKGSDHRPQGGPSIPSRQGLSTAPSSSQTSASLGLSTGSGFPASRLAFKALQSSGLPPPSVLRDSKMKTFYRISHGPAQGRRPAEPEPPLGGSRHVGREFMNPAPVNHVKKPIGRPKAMYLDLQILAGTMSTSSTPAMTQTDPFESRFPKGRVTPQIQENFKLGTIKRAVPVLPEEMKMQLSQRTQTAPNSTKPPLFGSGNFPRNYSSNPFHGKAGSGSSQSKVPTPQTSARSRTHDQTGQMNRTFHLPRTGDAAAATSVKPARLPATTFDAALHWNPVQGSKDSRSGVKNFSMGAFDAGVATVNIVPNNLRLRGSNKGF